MKIALHFNRRTLRLLTVAGLLAVLVCAPLQAQAPRQSCPEINTGLMRMTKNMPAEVSLGQEFMYELNAQAVACVANVVIMDQVPQGATYVRSEPEAQVEGSNLVWRFPEMAPGDAHPIKVWLRADQEGRLAACSIVTADLGCARDVRRKPVLAIAKSGPEMAQVGVMSLTTSS